MRVGPANAYLVEGQPLTLIDVGLNAPDSLAALSAAVASRGHRLTDIEFVVLTHGHHDHSGAAGKVAAMAGASVAAHRLLASTLADPAEAASRENAYRAALMRLHGVEPDTIDAFMEHRQRVDDHQLPVQIDHPVQEGDRLSVGGRTLAVDLRPGHSWVDTVFVDEADEVMWSGDHLLPDISTTAVAARPLDGNDDVGNRPSALRAYVGSLNTTASTPLRSVLPGHGPPFRNHRRLIRDRLRALDRRTSSILELLGNSESMTARDLAKVLWPKQSGATSYLTLSVVLGHLDLLADRGLVRELRDDERVRFEAIQPDERPAGR
jgi:glyoxylase-like metal-dependent hydrolase (beta-lactamase superfamily II)